MKMTNKKTKALLIAGYVVLGIASLYMILVLLCGAVWLWALPHLMGHY